MVRVSKKQKNATKSLDQNKFLFITYLHNYLTAHVSWTMASSDNSDVDDDDDDNDDDKSNDDDDDDDDKYVDSDADDNGDTDTCRRNLS